MSDRITNKQLEYLVNQINKLTGMPEKPYTSKNGLITKANIGNYHIDSAYSGVKLVQMVNEGGGIRVISNEGYGKKRQLYIFLQAFLRGLETAKEGVNHA